MAWFGRLIHQEVANDPSRAPSSLSLLSLLDDSGDTARRQGPGQSAQGLGEIQRLVGMTPAQLDETLQSDAARAILLTGLIHALDSEDFDQRTQAANALQLVLGRASHIVLPALMEASHHPLNLEHQRRLDRIIGDFLGNRSIVGGVTYDGAGRPTRFNSEGYQIAVGWSPTNLQQIDYIVAMGDGITARRSHILERQPDGSYLLFDARDFFEGGNRTPLGTARREDISVSGVRPPYLVYRVSLAGGGAQTFRFQIGD
jgi:hypothetical protein